MLNNSHSNVERIIAKIDNDFNPDNSDWISRVPAWTIDCMAQLKVLSVVRKRRTLPVYDKIAVSSCPIDTNSLKVYDKRGCQIKEYNGNSNKCLSCFTGGNSNSPVGGTISIEVNDAPVYAPTMLAEDNNSKDFAERHILHEVSPNGIPNSYIVVDENKIELTFDTDYIIIENNEIETYFDNYFNTELPIIPNNGVLIEAIVYYCMYKMLTRGYNHQVFSLAANNLAINPYLMWEHLKSKAKTSIINSNQKNLDTDIWRSYFYNFTFPNR